MTYSQYWPKDKIFYHSRRCREHGGIKKIEVQQVKTEGPNTFVQGTLTTEMALSKDIGYT